MITATALCFVLCCFLATNCRLVSTEFHFDQKTSGFLAFELLVKVAEHHPQLRKCAIAMRRSTISGRIPRLPPWFLSMGEGVYLNFNTSEADWLTDYDSSCHIHISVPETLKEFEEELEEQAEEHEQHVYLRDTDFYIAVFTAEPNVSKVSRKDLITASQKYSITTQFLVLVEKEETTDTKKRLLTVHERCFYCPDHWFSFPIIIRSGKMYASPPDWFFDVTLISSYILKYTVNSTNLKSERRRDFPNFNGFQFLVTYLPAPPGVINLVLHDSDVAPESNEAKPEDGEKEFDKPGEEAVGVGKVNGTNNANKTPELSPERPTLLAGYEILMLDTMAARLNFSYKLIQPPDGVRGTFQPSTGHFNGMIDQITLENVHFGIGSHPVIYEISQFVRFTKPFKTSPIRFATRRLGIQSQWRAIISPYSWQVWILLLLAFVVVSETSFYVTNLALQKEFPSEEVSSTNSTSMFPPRWFTRMESFLVIVRLYSNQDIGDNFDDLTRGNRPRWAGGTKSKSEAPRIWYAALLLYTMIIVISYSTTLTGYLAVPPEAPIPTSVKELLSSDYSIHIREGSPIDLILEGSSYPTDIALQKKLSDQPPDIKFVEDEQEGINRLFALDFSAYVENDDILMTSSVKVDKVPLLYLSSERYAVVNLAWPLIHNSPWENAFNKYMEKFVMYGLINHWYRQTLLQLDRKTSEVEVTVGTGLSALQQSQISEISSLRLRSFEGAFVMLAIGYVIAVAVLADEYYDEMKQGEKQKRLAAAEHERKEREMGGFVVKERRGSSSSEEGEGGKRSSMMSKEVKPSLEEALKRRKEKQRKKREIVVEEYDLG